MIPFNSASKEVKHKAVVLRGEIRRVAQKCYNPGCENNSIRSHILQENRILNRIADKDGFIYQLDQEFYKDIPIQIKKCHIGNEKGDVLTFFGFCSVCDHLLFLSVEKNEPILTNYKHRVLLSYRAFCNELYKIEYNIKWYDAILERNDLKEIHQWASEQKMYFESLRGFCYHNKVFLEQEISKPNEKIIFVLRFVKGLDAATSAVFNTIDLLKKQTENFYVHVIPRTKELTAVLIGYHGYKYMLNDMSIDDLEKIDETEIKYLVSGFFLQRFETWSVSCERYKKWCDIGLIDEILKIKSANVGQRQPFLRLNLFN